MKLYSSPTSPFARMVQVVLLETGLQDDVEIVPVATSALSSNPDLIAVNPVGRIPTLVRPDGPAMFDSRVICRFLDARAKSGLYPDSRIWEVLTLEALGHGITESALAMAYERKLRPAEIRWDLWMDKQWEKAARGLGSLETRWMSHLNGPLNIGQIVVACSLSYIDFRHGDRGWRRGHESLAAWHAEFEARPSMQTTRPAE
ncbi:MAG: glutathione S-transferase [Rhodobacteraceae bacterium]|nr:glutathione S-transferase [Paracoccaceae bacterium]